MKKKNKKIIEGVIALSVLSLVGGGIAVAQASANNSDGLGAMFGGRQGKGQEQRVELTDAQKTEMQAKIDAIKSALEAGDYNAWMTAVKAMNPNSQELKKVTADNFAEFVTAHKNREAEMTAQRTKMDAVRTALDNSDYNAWVTAVKAVDSDSSLLTKITASNFPQYVQAHKLREQANTIMKDLGIEGRGMSEPGMGGRHEGSRGLGLGGMMRLF